MGLLRSSAADQWGGGPTPLAGEVYYFKPGMACLTKSFIYAMKTLSLLLILLTLGLWTSGWGEVVQEDPGQAGRANGKIPTQNRSEMWVLPSLPQERDCLTAGCCLMPIIGYVVAREAFKTDTAQPRAINVDDRWGIGVGYSPGICWTGSTLQRYDEGLPIDPTASLYWLNSLEGVIRYRISPKYNLTIGGGWMWAYLENRNSGIICIIDRLRPHINTDWSVWHIPVLLGIEKSYIQGNKFWGVQMEFYFGKGVNIEAMDYENKEHLYISVWARGFGFSFGYGVKNRISNRVALQMSSALRWGKISEYKNDAPDNILWEPTTFYPTGIYFKLALFYDFMGDNSENAKEVQK